MKSLSICKKMFVMVAAAMMVFAGVTWSNASIVFENYITFSGNPGTPLGSLTATFENITGGVTLTMTATSALAAQKITEWYFNYSGETISSSSVTYSPTSTGPAAQSVIWTDPIKADGDGYFDLMFNFNTGGNASGLFNGGEKVVYKILGTDLTENSFLFLSWDTKSSGAVRNGYYSAAHVQALPSDGVSTSGWVALQPVPIPPSVFLLACGLVGMVGVHRLRKK